MTDWKTRLHWHRTSPDVADDFHADAPGEDGYCRIYLSVHRTHPDGQWYWAAAEAMRALGTGFAPSAREAAQRAEAALFETIEDEGSGCPTQP